MTSRERVLCALSHQQPDKIPVDFGATAVTGIHAKMVAALRDYYHLEKRLVRVHEPYQMLGL
ncbi:MAG: methyltransferase, partial [Calditrichaeota bacterium]